MQAKEAVQFPPKLQAAGGLRFAHVVAFVGMGPHGTGGAEAADGDVFTEGRGRPC